MPFNHTDLLLLPTFSDFPARRKVGELYCDRSVQIAELAARKPGLFYLGRPRMFGRTFLLTTLKALFKEGAAVFEGLAGEGLWHEKPCEVVEIQHMSLCSHFSSDEDGKDCSPTSFGPLSRTVLTGRMTSAAAPFGMPLDSGSRDNRPKASCFLSMISSSRLLTRLTAMGFVAR